MLKKKHRLPRYGFAQIPKLDRLHSKHFCLFYSKNPEISGGAVVVPKKVAKRATDRQLLKRRMRAVLGEQPTMTAAFVLLAKQGARRISFCELREEALLLFQKALKD